MWHHRKGARVSFDRRGWVCFGRERPGHAQRALHVNTTPLPEGGRPLAGPSGLLTNKPRKSACTHRYAHALTSRPSNYKTVTHSQKIKKSTEISHRLSPSLTLSPCEYHSDCTNVKWNPDFGAFKRLTPQGIRHKRGWNSYPKSLVPNKRISGGKKMNCFHDKIKGLKITSL